jgi:PAS domain S-box-containing protein
MAIQLKSPKTPWHFILIFSLLALGIGVTGYLYYEHQKKHIILEMRRELFAIADLKARQIVNWRKERMTDAEDIFQNSLIIHHIQNWLNTGQMSYRQEILSWMKILHTRFDYHGIFLLDAKRIVRLSVSDMDEPLGFYLETLAIEAVQTKKIIFTDLFRNEKTNHIHLDILIPLISKGPHSAPVGLLLLRIEPKYFLYPLIQSWPIPSPTAESLLVRREGDEVVFLNELRHRRNTALSLRFPIGKQQRIATMAVSGVESITEGADYQGVKVLAAVRPIPDSPWYLIAKVNQEEIYAPIREHVRVVIILAGTLILAAGVSIGLLWRHQVSQFYQKQYETELERRVLLQHFEYLMRYANDIILLMDENLKILEANDRAVNSYGYPREELLQLTVRDLRTPEARGTLDEMVDKIKKSQGMIYETSHQRKDGTHFPVEVSTRTIEIEGKIFLQGIIRDITERKRVEEQKEKLIRELQDALAKVKTLTGLLPICASCKKVRDDKGYWTQLEAYIRDHSEAEFSHGICPECMKKLYPDFAGDE